MSRAYKPRAGSKITQVLAFLEANPQRTLSKTDIVDMFGANPTNVATLMRPAVAAGALEAEKVSGAFVYRLPQPAEPAPAGDGQLQIANWNDGDVVVKGHTENQGGSVTFSHAQLRQLVEHVTTPHLALPVDRLQHAASA